ncbi:hypothetical protein J9253_05970 [Thiothrix litoralis]|uniref:Uncharacterized protein n=1 Tax=Thiothrix litoralis TaxID=2891210 RepID=A0ABX7WUU2_9GAMM|nr:hypothetical protein [Thiothrix litoralis]QTR47479.1 hypothetical protein J9253_05970 [Thiothrix litoralis]
MTATPLSFESDNPVGVNATRFPDHNHTLDNYGSGLPATGGGGGAADGNDVSTLVDNGDGTYTHTAGGVVTTFSTSTPLDLTDAATVTAIVDAIAASPDDVETLMRSMTANPVAVPVVDAFGVPQYVGLPV